MSALKDALRLEAEVTKKIRKVISICEDNTVFNDYHVSCLNTFYVYFAILLLLFVIFSF